MCYYPVNFSPENPAQDCQLLHLMLLINMCLLVINIQKPLYEPIQLLNWLVLLFLLLHQMSLDLAIKLLLIMLFFGFVIVDTVSCAIEGIQTFMDANSLLTTYSGIYQSDSIKLS